MRAIDELRYLDRGDGVCRHLTEKNLCDIYKHRPDMCNGRYVYENGYAHMPVEEFHKMIAVLCDDIRRRELEKLFEEVPNARRAQS
ncbi:MAG: YkgJ family cysteine cluster protein [Selenomonadaceae bacterium]|nr:YkgJ family cysteine cluster protein [Selenomonadaceae bacterium]MBR1580114.1 YkgJ family cysteine cluster protein [Selenomonadaceae bacterium]